MLYVNKHLLGAVEAFRSLYLYKITYGKFKGEVVQMETGTGKVRQTLCLQPGAQGLMHRGVQDSADNLPSGEPMKDIKSDSVRSGDGGGKATTPALLLTIWSKDGLPPWFNKGACFCQDIVFALAFAPLRKAVQWNKTLAFKGKHIRIHISYITRESRSFCHHLFLPYRPSPRNQNRCHKITYRTSHLTYDLHSAYTTEDG